MITRPGTVMTRNEQQRRLWEALYAFNRAIGHAESESTFEGDMLANELRLARKGLETIMERECPDFF